MDDYKRISKEEFKDMAVDMAAEIEGVLATVDSIGQKLVRVSVVNQTITEERCKQIMEMIKEWIPGDEDEKHGNVGICSLFLGACMFGGAGKGAVKALLKISEMDIDPEDYRKQFGL